MVVQLRYRVEGVLVRGCLVGMCHLCSVSCYGGYFCLPSFSMSSACMRSIQPGQASLLLHCCFCGTRESDQWPVVYWFNITPGQKLGFFSITSSSTDFKTCGWYTFLVSNPAASSLFPHFLNQLLVILLGILWGKLDSCLRSGWHWTRSFASPIETIKDGAFCCSCFLCMHCLLF